MALTFGEYFRFMFGIEGEHLSFIYKNEQITKESLNNYLASIYLEFSSMYGDPFNNFNVNEPARITAAICAEMLEELTPKQKDTLASEDVSYCVLHNGEMFFISWRKILKGLKIMANK